MLPRGRKKKNTTAPSNDIKFSPRRVVLRNKVSVVPKRGKCAPRRLVAHLRADAAGEDANNNFESHPSSTGKRREKFRRSPRPFSPVDFDYASVRTASFVVTGYEIRFTS